MRSGNWVSAPAMLSEHGAPGCGVTGSAIAGDPLNIPTAPATAATRPTAKCFMREGYTLLRSVRINVTS